MANINKRIRKSAPRSTLADLDGSMSEGAAALKNKERIIRKKMKRIRVEMVANRLGFPIGSQSQLTFAQAAAKRRKFLLQAAEFAVTAILFFGACSWLYKWWLSRQ